MNRFISPLKLSYLTVIFLMSATLSYSQHLTDNQIKKNVSAINQPLQSILSLQPRTYEYNNAEYAYLKFPQGQKFGFISEEFQHVFPGLVYKKPVSIVTGKNSTRNATVHSIDQESLIPLLIGAIKEQQTQIDQLRRELNELKVNIK